MDEQEARAWRYLHREARAAVRAGNSSLALYDEIERRLLTVRRTAAQLAHTFEPTFFFWSYQDRVISADMALNLLDGKRRRYVQRMVARIFAAPQRAPRRGVG